VVKKSIFTSTQGDDEKVRNMREEYKDQIKQVKEENIRLKEQLKSSSEHLDLALSAGNLAWWEMNVPTGKVVFNENKTKMLGYSIQEFKNCHYSAFTDLIHPDDYPKAMNAMREHLTGEKDLYEVVYRIKHKQGHYIWFYDRGSATQRDETGTPLVVKGIVFDDSKRQETLQLLYASKQKLKKANATKDQFLSIISHDLKNPIFGILGISQMLNEQYDAQDDEKRKMLLGKLEEAAEGTYSLLEQLLTWSKTQRSKITFHSEELRLSELIREVFLLLKQSAQRKEIKLRSQVSEKILITADKLMLHTILRNLISNAIKFSFKGGEVVVTCEKPTDGLLEISIKDNGLGIPQEELPKVLSLDDQYKQKGTDNEEGTGLGLLLCKDFVEKHGGQLLLTSEEGKGTTVAFTIPDHQAK